jgi:glycosyltransferase involved in cell wall biosynthesis
VLLRAWKLVTPRFPDAHLALLGGGGAFRNVEKPLRELRDQLGLTASTHLLGHVDNVVEYLLAADLFVLPTSTEGMSNALLEAMAAGSAIVTTDIEPNRELLQPGVHARLVPPRVAAAVAAASGAVLADDALRDALGRAARRRAQVELSVTRMVDSYLEAYRALLRPAREREARP